MRRTDKIDGLLRVTELQPRDGKRRQGRQKTRWRYEIRSFIRLTWNKQAVDRDE